MLGRKKSALLIDFDNVIGMTGGELAQTIPKWLAWLEAGEFEPKRKRREFAIKRVYWNGLNERYRAAFEHAGFEAFACRAIAKEKKSSADIVLTLDAMEIAGSIRGLKEVMLLSSDTDFVPVVNRLQDRGLEVVAMGNEENTTAAVYRDFADAVVLRRDFAAAFAYEPQNRTWFSNSAAKSISAAQPAPKSASIAGASPTLTEKPSQSPPATSVRRAAVKLAPKAQPRLEEAADRLVRAAEAALGAPLSREAVRRALKGVDGFSTTGGQPWLGCGSYNGLVGTVVQKRPQQLRLHKHHNGGVAIAFKAQA